MPLDCELTFARNPEETFWFVLRDFLVFPKDINELVPTSLKGDMFLLFTEVEYCVPELAFVCMTLPVLSKDIDRFFR